jgi:hypothetical protein
MENQEISMRLDQITRRVETARELGLEKPLLFQVQLAEIQHQVLMLRKLAERAYQRSVEATEAGYSRQPGAAEDERASERAARKRLQMKYRREHEISGFDERED